MIKVLFICSNNRDRSKTAEDIYKSDNRFEVRSAGVELEAECVVTKDLVNWADVIVVMNEKEDRQAFKLHQRFPYLKPMNKRIVDLEIPDKYSRGEPELINLITQKMEKVFGSSNPS